MINFNYETIIKIYHFLLILLVNLFILYKDLILNTFTKGEIFLLKYKGISFAILSSISFGIMPLFARIAYENGSNPTTVLIFRFLIAGLALFIYLKYKNVDLKVQKKQLLILLLIGFLGYTITTQTLFISYDYLGGGLATTLHFIYPVVVCLIGFIFFKYKMSKNKIISLILASLGVYSLIAFENNTLNAFGVFLALFSGVSYGTNVIGLSLKSIRNLDNRVVTMYVCLGAAFGMIILGLFENSIVLEFNVTLIISYLILALITTIASMIFLLKAIEIIGPTSSSILGTFEPIISIILGVIFLNEDFSFALIIGCTLILSSTVILAIDK